MNETIAANANAFSLHGETTGTMACEGRMPRPACPVCGGRLIEVRAKLQCGNCHRIVETCCEGGPG